MATAFDDTFAALKQVFRKKLGRLDVKCDTATEYTLVGRKPSPFPQHKGHPMFFAVRAPWQGLRELPSPTALHERGVDENRLAGAEERMQAKRASTSRPRRTPALIKELERLTQDGFKAFDAKGWL